MIARTAIFVLVLLMASAPAMAQEPLQLPLFDGALVLQADAGIRQDVREANGALIDFWRPVTFGQSAKPIGGRMDCKLVGAREDYSDALFDIRQAYRDARNARGKSGLDDQDSDYTENGNVRRLEVVGRSDPAKAALATRGTWPRYGLNTLDSAPADQGHWHYVVTNVAVRAEPYIYAITLNCEFRHLDEPDRKTDYAAIMRKYVDIGVPLAPPPTPASDG